jgi:amino acid transporter
MQIIRTVALIIVTAILVAFIAMNWTRAVINLWPQGDGTYVHLECPVGLIAILFFFGDVAGLALFAGRALAIGATDCRAGKHAGAWFHAGHSRNAGACNCARRYFAL